MKNYLFCQIDILGFSDLICNPPRELSINNIEKSYNLIFQKNLKDCKDFHQELPGFLLFSDTAFIYKEDFCNCYNFILYLSNVLQNSFYSIKNEQENLIPQLYFKFPLRGAFSIGSLVINNNNIIGKPIVSTYQWERLQNWIGISIPYNDISNVTNDLPECEIKKIMADNLLIEYDVPTKNGIFKTYAINFISKDNKNKIISIIEQELLNYKDQLNIYTKYYSTKKFVEYIISNSLYVSN